MFTGFSCVLRGAFSVLVNGEVQGGFRPVCGRNRDGVPLVGMFFFQTVGLLLVLNIFLRRF